MVRARVALARVEDFRSNSDVGVSYVENKVVLITGAAKGMGESHTRVCAGYGAIVVLVDLDQKGEAVAQSIRDGGGQAQASTN